MEEKKGLFYMEDHTSEFDAEDIQANKMLSMLGYWIFFLPMLSMGKSKFAKFHANQCLLKFLFMFIPIVGGIYGIVYLVIGLLETNKGFAKELPIIGKYKLIKWDE